SAGTVTVATTGFSFLCSAASTPPGSARLRTWIEWPTARLPRSTSMYSGRSSGRQTTSSSLSTWLTTPPCSFTPGDFSAFTKCSGTFMWIFLSLTTRWKSKIGRASCRERVYIPVGAGSLRRRHTRFSRDWSSDVCSSDLAAEVDLDVFRQIIGQADDVELVEHVADDAALLLHAGGLLGVHEVQRHLHVDLLVLDHALEVEDRKSVV